MTYKELEKLDSAEILKRGYDLGRDGFCWNKVETILWKRGIDTLPRALADEFTRGEVALEAAKKEATSEADKKWKNDVERATAFHIYGD